MFMQRESIDLSGDRMAMQRLRTVAEQIKIELSRRKRALVKVDEIAYGTSGRPLTLNLEMTREQLNMYAHKLIERTFPVCRDATRMAGLTPAQVGSVVLVGGTTRMPYVREQVASFFKCAPRIDVNPDQAVAMGAALQGMALHRTAPTPKSELPTFRLERSSSTTQPIRPIALDDDARAGCAAQPADQRHRITGSIDLSSDQSGSIELDLAALLESPEDSTLSMATDNGGSHDRDRHDQLSEFDVGGASIELDLEQLAALHGDEEPTQSALLPTRSDPPQVAASPSKPATVTPATDVTVRLIPESSEEPLSHVSSLGQISAHQHLRTTEVPILAMTQAVLDAPSGLVVPTIIDVTPELSESVPYRATATCSFHAIKKSR